MSERDFTIADEGTIYILTPHTKAAREWVAEKISQGHQEFCGGVVVEHRYILDIAEGIRGDGLSINN